MSLAAALCLTAGVSPAQVHPFQLANGGEVIADLELSSPGADWSVPGHEAALVRVLVDRSRLQHVMLFAGAKPHHYRIFLGDLNAGPHSLTLERDESGSAAGAGLKVHAVAVTPAGPDPIYSHAPVLFARANTIGRFSDVPMLMFAEKLSQDGHPVLQYTVIFSNEDGGTSTRDLMARWGRATDIEYVYRVPLDGGGAIIQGPNHQDQPFNGRYEGRHPLLMPVTDNNMISGESSSPVRYQLAPVLADATLYPREHLMNERPETWRTMAQELSREDKLRPYGQVMGEKISDPRNYLYIQYRARYKGGALGASVGLKGTSKERSSTMGRTVLAIDRAGWVQTSVELPPKTAPAQIGSLRFECYRRSDPAEGASTCELLEIGRVYSLDENYRPRTSVFQAKPAALLNAGESMIFPVAARVK